MLKILLLISIVSNIYASTITVAIASNIIYALPELKKEFYKIHPNIKIREIISGSAKLTAQIKHNAPFDIFMSANMKYPNSLYTDGFTINKPKIYAKGKLALLSYKKYDYSNIYKLLKNNKIKKIAIANPKLAPYGKASEQYLKNIKIYENIKYKFVYAQSISQTLLYTLNACDIGIVALSSLKSTKLKEYKENINYIKLDTKLYTPISQGIVILKKAKKNNNAKVFYEFILSKKAKKIFLKYGYDVL